MAGVDQRIRQCHDVVKAVKLFDFEVGNDNMPAVRVYDVKAFQASIQYRIERCCACCGLLTLPGSGEGAEREGGAKVGPEQSRRVPED